MKQKTKQLQSSGETRKTNRIWHFLSTLNSLLLSKLLLLLIIPVIGSTAAWATDEVVTIGSKDSGAFTISGTSHAVAGYSGGSNSATITAASDGQTASAGSKLNVVTKEIGSALSNKSHIRFTVVAGETVRLYVYWGSDSQSATFRTSDYSQSSNYLHEGKLVSSASKNTLQFVDFTFENAGTYAISVVSGNNPYMAAIKFTASSAYTVTFNANGHGLIDGNATKALTEGSAGAGVTPPTVTAASGYTLAGTWHTAATCTEANKVTLIGGKYMPSSNGITLYAGYNYKVTFDAATNGGTCGTSNLTQTSAGASITLPEATKTGYNLNGWFTASTSDTNRGTSSYVPTDNETLYAQFTAKTYSITLNANGGSAVGSATATYNSNKLTGITAPTYSDKVVEGYYMESGYTTKIADASGNLVASVAEYTDASGNWTRTSDATLYAKWVDASSSYTPFNLSSADAVIDFSASEWSTSAATALFDAANAGNGANTPINNVVFRGQTSGGKKAFTISDGKLVMDVGNGQSGNRWFAIPLTNINGRIDVYIKVPYAKGTSFSVKAVLDKGTTTVGTSATNLNAVKLDYVDNYFGTGEGAFHFRIKDFTQTTGVLYIGRNGSSWTDINKIKIVSRAVEFSVSPTSVTVTDGGTQDVVITNNTPYAALINDASLDKSKATYTYDGSSTITFTGVSAGSAGSIQVYLDKNANGVYDAGTDTQLDSPISVTVTGITISDPQPASAVYSYGASAAALSVTASNTAGGDLTYQWYRNTVNSNTGGVAISGATSSSYTPSTTRADEDASFYYCVVSAEGVNSVTSDVAYILTSKTGRYFQMSNVAGNKSTGDAVIDVTGQTIAGGTVEFHKGTTSESGKYVNRASDALGHYFYLNEAAYFKVTLAKAISVGDVISVKVNAVNGTERGISISDTEAPSLKTTFTTTATTDQTLLHTVVAGDTHLVGKKVLYINDELTTGYFRDLTITQVPPVTVGAAQPATQTVQQNDPATEITVTAFGGTGSYKYEWYQDTSASGSFDTPATGATNSPSYTPGTGSIDTMYYKCKVSNSDESGTPAWSDAAEVVVIAKTFDYYTPVYGEGSTNDYTLSKTNYGDPGPNNTFWKVTIGKNGATDGTGATYGDSNKAMQIKNDNDHVKEFVFYVQNAQSFTLTTSSNSVGFDVRVDDGETQSLVGESSTKVTPKVVLNPAGSKITVIATNSSSNLNLSKFTFYKYAPTTLTINGSNTAEANIYMDEDEVSFLVDTDGDGTINQPTKTSGAADATASYADGQLTVKRGTLTGTAVFTLTQDAGPTHEGASATLTVTVKKHQIAISVSASEVTLDAKDCGNVDDVIAASKLPVFTVTKDGEPYTPAAGEIKYVSDDNSVAYLSKTGDYSSTTYSVKYGGGQGGPTIIAYIDETPGCTHANNSYTLHITQGTDNFISKDLGTVKVQQVYPMDDANGVTVVKLVYGGYKYNSNTLDSTADSWTYYDGAKNAKMDGYTYNRRNGAQNANSEDKVEILSNPTDKRIWYQDGDPKDGGGTYEANERIKPFAMPCAGSYLMFEVKKTGILTAYVLQNGIVGWDKSNDGMIATNPRLGYWFDQDGWVQHPTSVVSKAVISDGNGRDQHEYSGKPYGTAHSLESVNFYGSDKDNPSLLYKQLTYKYCDNADNPNDYFETSGEGHTAINPYYWPKETESADGDVSIDANRAKQVPRKIRPIPYRNGYLMIEEGYLKYTLPVKAGQKYYFLGCGTRIGYVAMNFVENKNAFGTNTIDYVEDNVDLKGSDDWTSPTVRTGFTKPTKPTVYSQMTLKRNFTPNQWNTICLPFAVSEKDVEAIFGTGTKLCLYNGLTKKGGNAYVINFMRHVNQDILPGQPYFIYPTGTGVELGSNGKIGGTTGVEFYNVLVDPDKLTTGINYGSDNDREDGATVKNDEIRYKAVATLAPTAMKQNGFYINTNNGALMKYTPSSDLTVNTYRTFLQPNDWAGTNYSALSLDADLDVEDVSEEGDVPTMIIVVREDKAEIVNGKLFDGKAYNIMGQEVDAANAKGMVIVNGKKYFRK